MKREKHQYLEMNFQHLVLKVRLFSHRHHIYDQKARFPALDSDPLSSRASTARRRL